ncbi:MAG: TIGR02453 family protein, partial [Planctomycetota bacterium]
FDRRSVGGIMEPQEIETSPFEGMPRAAFRLLASLGERNERAWMEENVEAVGACLREPFLRFLEEATERLAAAGMELRGGAGTLFRMQRDLRFTSNRAPYHEHIEAVLSSDGSRIGTRGSIHVRLVKDGGFLRAGSFLLSPAARRALREAMVARSARFLAIVEDLENAGLGLSSDRALKSMPRGFAGVAADPKLASFLRLVDPYAELRLTKVAWRSERILDETLGFAEATRSWRLFMREALEDVPLELAASRPPRAPSRVSPEGPERRSTGARRGRRRA